MRWRVWLRVYHEEKQAKDAEEAKEAKEANEKAKTQPQRPALEGNGGSARRAQRMKRMAKTIKPEPEGRAREVSPLKGIEINGMSWEGWSSLHLNIMYTTS